MNKIRSLKSGRYKAKTNGGQFWTVVVGTICIGEIEAHLKQIKFEDDVVHDSEGLLELSRLINECHSIYNELNIIL